MNQVTSAPRGNRLVKLRAVARNVTSTDIVLHSSSRRGQVGLIRCCPLASVRVAGVLRILFETRNTISPRALLSSDRRAPKTLRHSARLVTTTRGPRNSFSRVVDGGSAVQRRNPLLRIEPSESRAEPPRVNGPAAGGA